MTVRVSLDRNGDFFALIDPEAEELVRRYRWSLHHCGKGKVYARAQRHPVTKQTLCLYMHRLVASHFLPPPADGHTVVDHGPGGSLDNRSHNLKWELPAVNRWVTARWRSEPASAEPPLPGF